MKAQDIMIENVYLVNEKDTVRRVIQTFIDQRISGMPIVNNDMKLVGYISDGDIMRYIGKHKDIVVDSLYTVNVFNGDDAPFEERVRRSLDLNVMDIATKKVISVTTETSEEKIAAILGKKQIKKLPVEQDSKLVGIISRGDVLRNTFKSILK
ncbi:CBS domain-containing protein [Sporosarcina sp. BI001-red]|uniref:CBS domain-containing protein n=1 Tax=Sporosarcina sp. BI001-red TaxID=2282866 RepID=UPI000E264440|nr:CBS domain-containing protein [Sporosarcina sp. BI001-red]REB11012.1 CBS domain-containing protein [Sporosarcina sp. BI001-red]